MSTLNVWTVFALCLLAAIALPIAVASLQLIYRTLKRMDGHLESLWKFHLTKCYEKEHQSSACGAWHLEELRLNPESVAAELAALRKSLEFFLKFEASVPEAERFRLSRKWGSTLADMGVLPVQYRLPSEICSQAIDSLHRLDKQYHNGVASASVRAAGN